ncbi:hypothetical protein PMIT1342_01867 [Prochlorococcus marinus str. MIT 1342]|uniref:class I SAM-dependent methyltransferase n=1 Tax=Prochlorococcus TaxID=1218 RepID=UPI0007B3B86E|nr:class I SAM-dependent methyltransferase [Prochlorococcus marinus]KZR79922.1 hypothetical protein PMIT1342_01867 [Prochlorococcus marinus str. MIT 1342]
MDCEVCGLKDLDIVMSLGPHPLCDDLIPIGENRTCVEYPIDILFCNKCYTAHQGFRVPKADLFPSTYHYRSALTQDVINGMFNLVDSIENTYGSLNGKVVLDIGCNDGSLLDIFKEKGMITTGVEPTGACQEASAKGHNVINTFFGIDNIDKIKSELGCPDIITFTNVFAHIEDLNKVIQSLLLLKQPHTILAIENHYLGSILDKNQFDTFYHEHPRTYSFSSFEFIADSLSMYISSVEFPKRYGGNIRVILKSKENSSQDNETTFDSLILNESQFCNKLALMTDFIKSWKISKYSEINSLVTQYGPLKAKAFPGRAAILIKLLQLDTSHISATYEQPNSPKIGHYIPGTKIPILSDESIDFKTEQQPIINLAWHIGDEISVYLKNKGFSADIINIL